MALSSYLFAELMQWRLIRVPVPGHRTLLRRSFVDLLLQLAVLFLQPPDSLEVARQPLVEPLHGFLVVVLEQGVHAGAHGEERGVHGGP